MNWNRFPHMDLSALLKHFLERDHKSKLCTESNPWKFPKDSVIILFKFLNVLFRTDSSNNRCHAWNSIKAKTQEGMITDIEVLYLGKI